MLLRICHTTEFAYGAPAFESHNEIRMLPRDGYGQTVIESRLELSTSAATLEYDDYFGNRVHAVSIHQPHESLRIAATSVIEKLPQNSSDIAPVPFEEFLRGHPSRFQSEYDFLRSCRLIPFSQPLREFFETLRPMKGDDIAGYAKRVTAALQQQVQYAPGATRVDSSVDEILARRAGVCQDFAHLAIGVLRLAAIPARYVSGYLAPSSGDSEDLALAAQASHAWVEANLPGAGWVGFDPTHGCHSDTRYVRVAIGRDYSDVPPLRGVYRGNNAGQTMKVELQVYPAPESDAPNGRSQQ